MPAGVEAEEEEILYSVYIDLLALFVQQPACALIAMCVLDMYLLVISLSNGTELSASHSALCLPGINTVFPYHCWWEAGWVNQCMAICLAAMSQNCQ